MKSIKRDKTAIISACEILLNERISNARTAMESAQESSNGEDKSSAGDKYETSRAMGHLNRNMYAKQLDSAMRDLESLKKINASIPMKVVAGGAAVVTENKFYFMASGIGKIMVGKQEVMVISMVSPIAAVMAGKKAGDSFVFNGVKNVITEIF